MVSDIRASHAQVSSSKDGGGDNVIVKQKTSLSLRRFMPFRGSKNQYHSHQSNRTAISTVCSFEEPNEGRQEEEIDPAAILTTRGGLEALLCPQQESRYLYDQGVEHFGQGRFLEASEALTQALSLCNGSDLEPRILWTLVSQYSQQDDEVEAGRYLTVLKPKMRLLHDEWIESEASLAMLSLLMEHKHWDTALKMTFYVETEDSVLARLYFETAANRTTKDAVPHLEKALSLCHDSEDESLKQSILHTLVHAHAAELDFEEALSVQESYMDSLQTPTDKAQAHHDAAELHIAQGHYEQALSLLNEGLELINDAESTSGSLTTAMLQAKAHTLYKLGDSPHCLVVYKSLLSRVKHCPSDAAKIYYTMGRICCKSGEYENALFYFKQELKLTKSALGKYHYENSRIYHDLGRIHDEALGNYEQGLKYYTKALKVEQRCLKKLPPSREIRNEVSMQILETQRCIGRIHYKQGEFNKAFSCSFVDDISI